MGDGLWKNIINSWKLMKYMGKIGKKSKITSKPEEDRRLDLMHRNISIVSKDQIKILC